MKWRIALRVSGAGLVALLALMWALPAPGCWYAGLGAAVVALGMLLTAWGMPENTDDLAVGWDNDGADPVEDEEVVDAVEEPEPAPEPVPEEPVNQAPAMGAVAELAGAAGADWRVYPDGVWWVAEATWPHTAMVADNAGQPDGHRTMADACNELAGMLLAGQTCPLCGRLVWAVDTAAPPRADEAACGWRLAGAHWTPGCQPGELSDGREQRRVAALMAPLRDALASIEDGSGR